MHVSNLEVKALPCTNGELLRGLASITLLDCIDIEGLEIHLHRGQLSVEMPSRFKPVQCSRCKCSNDPDARYCKKCARLILEWPAAPKCTIPILAIRSLPLWKEIEEAVIAEYRRICGFKPELACMCVADHLPIAQEQDELVIPLDEGELRSLQAVEDESFSLAS